LFNESFFTHAGKRGPVIRLREKKMAENEKFGTEGWGHNT